MKTGRSPLWRCARGDLEKKTARARLLVASEDNR
jgi:hypothetical protein